MSEESETHRCRVVIDWRQFLPVEDRTNRVAQQRQTRCEVEIRICGDRVRWGCVEAGLRQDLTSIDPAVDQMHGCSNFLRMTFAKAQ